MELLVDVGVLGLFGEALKFKPADLGGLPSIEKKEVRECDVM
jgi:hypothetical protein